MPSQNPFEDSVGRKIIFSSQFSQGEPAHEVSAVVQATRKTVIDGGASSLKVYLPSGLGYICCSLGNNQWLWRQPDDPAGYEGTTINEPTYLSD